MVSTNEIKWETPAFNKTTRFWQVRSSGHTWASKHNLLRHEVVWSEITNSHPVSDKVWVNLNPFYTNNEHYGPNVCLHILEEDILPEPFNKDLGLFQEVIDGVINTNPLYTFWDEEDDDDDGPDGNMFILMPIR